MTTKDLTILRTNLRRIAEVTGDPEVIAAIPAGDEFNTQPYAERGWNRLAAFICGWVEQHRKDDQ